LVKKIGLNACNVLCANVAKTTQYLLDLRVNKRVFTDSTHILPSTLTLQYLVKPSEEDTTFDVFEMQVQLGQPRGGTPRDSPKPRW
jgi:hypothetical protein